MQNKHACRFNLEINHQRTLAGNNQGTTSSSLLEAEVEVLHKTLFTLYNDKVVLTCALQTRNVYNTGKKKNPPTPSQDALVFRLQRERGHKRPGPPWRWS